MNDLQREQAAEARVGRNAFWTILVIFLSFWVISASSILIQNDIQGVDAPWLEPWLLEGTSLVAMIPLFYFVRWMERHAPLGSDRWSVAVPAHIAGSLVFAAITVLWMAISRAIIWPPLFGHAYDLLRDRPLQVFVYEYRKLLPGYVGPLALIFIFRQLEFTRLELEAARREAQSSQRLTLKCGGRILRIEAAGFISAKAAGNYVELLTATGEHLARMTLTQLEEQLIDAGVEAIRVHKSWLVNQQAITQIDPTGEGDVVLTLSNGGRVPGSRRYRHRLSTD